MKPLGFVIFQLVVLGFAYVAHVRHEPSLVYRFLWLASIGGVIGLDVWYLRDFAYPTGFKF
jgi:hypothetical protein